MNVKYTPNTLKKTEQLFNEMGYIVRYEKGTFSSGYCVLEHKKVVVVNKFLNIEGRINTLLEILPTLSIKPETLTEEMQKWYLQLFPDKKIDTAIQTVLNL